jgi:hypothetical protein
LECLILLMELVKFFRLFSSCQSFHTAGADDMAYESRRSIAKFISHWPSLLVGIKELIKAHEYATDSGVCVWEFAISQEELRQVGLSTLDIRWLLKKGFAVCREDLTMSGDSDRAVLLEGCGNQKGWLALTSLGFELLSGAIEPSDHTNNSKRANDIAPCWDALRHELWFNNTMIKRFRLPSPNQEKVLAAFQEEAWPPRIDDPLPHERDLDPRQRLHDTIRSLNRHHRHTLLRFFGDGTGEGVGWEQRDSQYSIM